MSKIRATDVTATVMGALRSAGGVAKSAGGATMVPLAAVETVVELLAEHIEATDRRVREMGRRIEETGQIIEALARPEPVVPGLRDFRAADWHVRLAKNAEPQPVNGSGAREQ